MSTRRPAALRALCLGAWLACTGLLGACAQPGAAPEALPGADRLVIAPLNLAVKLPVELEDGVGPVRDEIIAYLQKRHARVAVIWPADAWDLWRESMALAAAGSSPERRLEQAVGRFVAELREQTEFGAFMLPTLVYREARVWGQTARWDGVRRRLVLRARNDSNARLPTFESPIGDTRIQGERVPGVSLHVLVFSPDGRRTYEGWGGLDLVHAALVTGSQETGHGSLVQDANPFRNPENLREGIALALDAYVPAGAR